MLAMDHPDAEQRDRKGAEGTRPYDEVSQVKRSCRHDHVAEVYRIHLFLRCWMTGIRGLKWDPPCGVDLT